MNDKPEIQKSYSIEEMFKVAQERKKYVSSGRGVGYWLTVWSLIGFGVERWFGLESWPMWVVRSIALACLLLGTLVLGLSFDVMKESNR